jgi:cupin fold WbuC family metalloprotein
VPIEKKSDEVFQATGGVVQVRAVDVAEVVRMGTTTARKRSRLCAHPGPDDRLHEMLICLDRATYIRPHRHGGKPESFHVIDGELDVVVFHDNGSVREVVRMGPYHSGKAFYYRVMEPSYHTVLVRTPYALFHETTTGPFARGDTDYAPWSPAEGEPEVAGYVERLRAAVALPQAA